MLDTLVKSLKNVLFREPVSIFYLDVNLTVMHELSIGIEIKNKCLELNCNI